VEIPSPFETSLTVISFIALPPFLYQSLTSYRLDQRLVLRQYRTKIVVQTRSQLFRQIVRNYAGIPAYFNEFWAKMTEKMQAYAQQSAQRGLCAVLP